MKLVLLTLLLVQISPALANGNKQKQPTNNKQESPTLAPTKSVFIFNDQSASDKQKDSASNQAKQTPHEPPWWDTTWATWALVVVGLGGTVAALWTLRLVRRQANDTKTAAEAALLNAQALINSERAWIFCQWKRFGTMEFALSIKNFGRTPACIIDVVQKEEFVDLLPLADSHTLPQVPDYGPETRLSVIRVLPPNEVWSSPEWHTSSSFLPEQMLEEIRTSRKRHFIYGVVRYRDLLQSSEIHETRFCYFYSPPIDEFILGGPSDYTKYT